MHKISEFVDAFLVNGGQIYARSGYSQVLTGWHELKTKEKDEAIKLRCHQWTDYEIEGFLNDCSSKKDITQEISASEFFANIDRLKKGGGKEELSTYMESSSLNGELRRLCRVLAKELQTRCNSKSRHYLDIFKAK